MSKKTIELEIVQCDYVNENGHLGAMLVDVPLDDESLLIDLIEERQAILSKALDGGDKPDPEPGFLCGYCPHTQCPWSDV